MIIYATRAKSMILTFEPEWTQASQQRRLTTAEVGRRFKSRLQRFNKACRKYSNSSQFRRIMKSPQLDRVEAYRPATNISVEICRIEKTASTTWGKLFQSIRKKMERLGIKKTRNLTKIKNVRFIFVREPYSRLLSAYTDKLFCPNTVFWAVGRYIVKKFRPNPSNLSLACGHDVTFPEFIRYFIHSQQTRQHRDGHFVPIHDHCGLCTNVTYDYIGHLETLGEDMPYLLKVMQSPMNYTTDFESHTLFDNAHWVLNRMTSKIKTCMSMKEACLRLWKKWQVRGILSKTEPLPVTRDEAEVITTRDFANLALQALGRSGPREQRRQQKAEALVEAFAAVPLKDRLKLQKLLFLDFELFGFHPSPDSIFPTDTAEVSGDSGYRYFDLED
ncbi:hypothetical protein ACOMHN_037106 [Nucella lapillus]